MSERLRHELKLRPLRRTARWGLASLVATTAMLYGGSVAEAGPADHFEFSVAGEELADCPSGSYTIKSGSIAVTVHHDGPYADPSGDPPAERVQFAISARPVDVVLENERHEPFRLVGVDRITGTYNPRAKGWVVTSTLSMSIVRGDGGGVVDRFRTVARLRDDRFVMIELGSCHWP